MPDTQEKVRCRAQRMLSLPYVVESVLSLVRVTCCHVQERQLCLPAWFLGVPWGHPVSQPSISKLEVHAWAPAAQRHHHLFSTGACQHAPLQFFVSELDLGCQIKFRC